MISQNIRKVFGSWIERIDMRMRIDKRDRIQFIKYSRTKFKRHQRSIQVCFELENSKLAIIAESRKKLRDQVIIAVIWTNLFQILG